MTDIKLKHQQRFLFLKKLYELLDDDPNQIYSCNEVGKMLGLDSTTAEKTASFLKDQGLVDIRTREKGVALTHPGVLEVEAALAEPEQPTEHFPPIINLIQINAPSNGFSIQQGTIGSTQTNTISVQQGQDLKEIIAQLKAIQESLELGAKDREELKSDISTLEAQAASPKPKTTILAETLKSVKSALGKAVTKVASHAATQTIDTATPEVMEMIDRWLGQHTP